MVSEEALHAVLVERTNDGLALRAHFRQSRGDQAAPDDPYAPDSGFEEDAFDYGEDDVDNDVTIQFGDDTDGGDLFLGSEFEDLGGGDGGTAPTPTGGNLFRPQVDAILAQCADRGYDDPAIAFCAPGDEIDDLELRLPADEGTTSSDESETGLPLPAKRKKLLSMVDEQYDGTAEKERVGLVPMRPTHDGRHRVLALIARPTGAAIGTARSMREAAESPPVAMLDAETSLYAGLVRHALQTPAGASELSLFVRASSDDTLVLFMEGNTLLHAENLPSLTAHDPAETICSRVLLLQDEYGIGEVDHVLLVGEDGEGALVSGFEPFFPDARVHALRDFLPPGEIGPSSGDVAAAGMALRALGGAEAATFYNINLLPKALTKRSFSLPGGWATPVLLTLLGITTLGFVWYYVDNAREIEAQRQTLARLTERVEKVDQQALQTRIDSLNATTERYTGGMSRLNTLLRGSNKWSKTLSVLTQETDSVKGIWVENWTPQTADMIRLEGYATARTRIARFAEKLDGNIMGITFTEIRDWPVFQYQMDIPLDTSIPEAVEYWRAERREMMQVQTNGPASPPASSAALRDGAQ